MFTLFIHNFLRVLFSGQILDCILHHSYSGVASHCHHGLWVELDGCHRFVAVLECHHRLEVVLLRFGCHHQVGWQGRAISAQRMVATGRHRTGEPGEQNASK